MLACLNDTKVDQNMGIASISELVRADHTSGLKYLRTSLARLKRREYFDALGSTAKS